MATILDLAKSVVAKPYASTYYRKNSKGVMTSWCQEFVGNSLTEAGVQYSGSYASANASRIASTIASKDPTKAPPGAIHYFMENHVTLACGGSGYMIGATPRSGGSILALGKSVYVHAVAGYPLTYVGWSYGNGTRPPIKGFTDPYAQPVAAHQRKTNVETRLRYKPARDGDNYNPSQNQAPGTVLTPQGWINGETIDGSSVWFKIGENQWAHASCFTDRGTHDIRDLNTYAGMRVVLGTIPNGSIRADATTASDKLGIVTPNQQVPVTRYKKGENVVSGTRESDVWFEVPAGAGKGFAWAGSFTDPSTKDLTEIVPTVPPPAVDLTRKVVGKQALNVRQYPSTASQVKGTMPLETEVTITTYTKGDSVTSSPLGTPITSNIWYVVEGGVAWSGAFDSQSVDGMTYVDITMPAQQYPTEKFAFAADFPDITSRVVPSDWSNFENEYSQPNVALRKGFSASQEFIVRHQWGAPGAYSLESVLNTFQGRHLNSDDKVSPHFTIGINTLTGNVEIIQNLPLSVRAYHAGSGGNDYIGVEIDPRISLTEFAPRLIAAVRTLEERLSEKYQRRLTAKYHEDLPGASTTCGTYIKPVAAELDAPFPEDSDENYDWDAGFISVQAAIAAMRAEMEKSFKAVPTAEENGEAARFAIVK